MACPNYQLANCRCSTDEQDITAQIDALEALGINPKRIYVGRGTTGRNKNHPGLREALAAGRAGSTFMVKRQLETRAIRELSNGPGVSSSAPPRPFAPGCPAVHPHPSWCARDGWSGGWS
ncbi:recombinase family protein [Arthrobacter castelli]|uniref:recombinase family protein n=1 Tax=Arthrobacter castelli TaxID=271431 RepID=UPI0009D67007